MRVLTFESPLECKSTHPLTTPERGMRQPGGLTKGVDASAACNTSQYTLSKVNLHLEPFLDASTLRSDVISSTEILSFSTRTVKSRHHTAERWMRQPDGLTKGVDASAAWNASQQVTTLSIPERQQVTSPSSERDTLPHVTNT